MLDRLPLAVTEKKTTITGGSLGTGGGLEKTLQLKALGKMNPNAFTYYLRRIHVKSRSEHRSTQVYHIDVKIDETKGSCVASRPAQTSETCISEYACCTVFIYYTCT